MTTVEKTSKDKFQEAIDAGLHKPEAQVIAKEVIAVLLNASVSNSYADLTAKIAEASKNGDIEQILKLSNDLKNVKDNRSSHEKTFKQLTDKYDFADVLQAFKPQFEALAYDAAYKALTTAETTIKKSGKGGAAAKPAAEKATRTETVYEITKGDKTVTFPIRAGRSKLSMDKEAFEFLGFKIVLDEDGKEALEPGTIEVAEGKFEPATRKSIAESIASEEINVKMFEGFTAKKL